MLSWNEKKGIAIVTTGEGHGKTPLSAFDAAEVNANIHATNAIKVTSFIPSTWEISDNKKELLRRTQNARFVPMAFEYKVSNNLPIAASVGIGISANKDNPRIIMQHTATGTSLREIEQITTSSIHEVFSFRGWELKDIIQRSIEAVPKKGMYACALVGVLFFPEND